MHALRPTRSLRSRGGNDRILDNNILENKLFFNIFRLELKVKSVGIKKSRLELIFCNEKSIFFWLEKKLFSNIFSAGI